MSFLRWSGHPRTMAAVALACALVPAWLAVVTYRDAKQKDVLVYETTTQVLAEKLQNQFERHTYLPREVRQLARNLDDAALDAGKMFPVFRWQEKVTHLLAVGYARLEGERIIVRWMSEQRRPVAAVGDDLAALPGVVSTLRAAPANEPFITMGCLLEPRMMLVLLTLPGATAASAPRGYVAAWIDLKSMCQDPDLPLLRDKVLAAAPTGTESTPPEDSRTVVIRDGEAKWTARIQRGSGFRKYGVPTPWLTFTAIGLSTVPLLVLATLAGRAAKLRAALAGERELSRTQSCFFNSVSHEFRTPLSVILSGADLLESYAGQISEKERSHLLAQIKGNTKLMNDMVEHVLMLGRMDSKKLQPKLRLIPARAFCDEVSREVCAANQDRCAIVVNARDEEVWLDASLMRSILGNLLSNAVKYSAPGSEVRLDVRVTDDSVAFTISDSGIGIPPEDLPHVCEPFHRSGNVGSVPGTGLGLAIVQRCTMLLGGTFAITSTPGRGTAATVTLRRQPV